MKNYRNLFLITASALLLFVGCNDAIEIDQPGRLDAASAFQTEADFQAGMYWLYNNLDSTPEIALSAVYTDEVAVGVSSGGQGLAQLNYVLTPGSTASSNFWTRNYRVVNFASRMIEAAASITGEGVDTAKINNLLGQAHAIRAYAMTELVSYYSTDLGDDNALGVIAIDYVPSLDEQLLRNTNAETFALINSDIEKAMSLIASTTTDVTVFTKDAVTALKARVAAYRQDYATALSAASTLVAKYDLATVAEYPDVFADDSDAEIIFKLERTIGDDYDGQGSMGSTAAGGWAGARFCFKGAIEDPYFEVSRSLFNILDANDVRHDIVVNPNSTVDADYTNSADYKNTDILYVGKYLGSEGQKLMNDLKIFRASEMVLIVAEAQVAQNNLADAAQTIKTLRDARFGTDTTAPSFSSQQDAFGAILDERRVEFAFEGHRYKDLKRLGIRGNRNAVKDAMDCKIAGAANCSLNADDYRFTLPIPLIEFNGNPGLREQQNPGY